MSESGVSTRMKRYGGLLFKNPPQPHMCIQVYLQDSQDTSFINVLSWDKVPGPSTPSEPIPFYGGMRVSASRHEKNDISVYAVIAHPEVLRINGKNAQDPEKRNTLIEDILDYVEATNREVKFMRVYSILKDRDITGELKKVWTAVQSRQDKEEMMQQQETWIDAQPDVPFDQHRLQDELNQQKAQAQQAIPQNAQPPNYQSNDNYQRVNQYAQQPNPDRYTAPNCPAYPSGQYQQPKRPQYVNGNQSFELVTDYSNYLPVVEQHNPVPQNDNEVGKMISRLKAVPKAKAEEDNQTKKEADNKTQSNKKNLQVTDLDEAEPDESSKRDEKETKSKSTIIKMNPFGAKDKAVKNESTESEMARLSISDKEDKKEESIKNGFAKKSSDSPKRVQTAMNNIMKSVFKQPSSSSEEGSGLFVKSNKKSSGQVKNDTKAEEERYTILKKDGSAEEVNEEYYKKYRKVIINHV